METILQDLRYGVRMLIKTPSFTIVGRILTTSIKAKAELFGDVDLPVSRMRAMRSMSGLGQDTEVVIDAGKYANAGQWMETDFQVDGRSAQLEPSATSCVFTYTHLKGLGEHRVAVAAVRDDFEESGAVTIKLKDVLLVGLGDSNGSGEGNPDKVGG